MSLPAARENQSVEFLAGGGELGELMRRRDWSGTPLGPVAQWPQSLKTTVSLMLNSQQPIWVGWGPEATFLYNDAYISVLSRAKHPHALGAPFSQVWAEIWDVCAPLADKVFKQGRSQYQEDVRLFMRREDFVEEVFYSFSYSPIRDESGGVAGLFCPNVETTAKVIGARRLAALSELAARGLVKGSVAEACATAMDILAGSRDDVPFALLFAAQPDGTLRLDASCNTSDAQERLGASALWQADAVLAERQARTVDVPAGVPGLPRGLADQAVRRVRVLPVADAGAAQPYGVLVLAASPARPMDREYLSFFDLVANQLASTVQNARAAEETRARAEKLAQLDRAKTLFFSNVSHELRTPLTLMLGPLQDLLDDPEVGRLGHVADALALALRNGRRLHRLVNSLLDFSRIEAGRVSAHYAPVDLARYTAELASHFAPAVHKAGLQFSVACEALPEEVHVDAEMWEKVVLNLLSNAFKYTLAGHIRVGLHAEGGQAVLTVQDTGHGIPAHELPRLFERFHRVEGTQGRTHEGTGIGLALVQELVKLHGGAIAVHSTLGEGSKFEVRIPFGARHLPPEQVHTAPRAPSGAAATLVAEAWGWLPGADAGVGTPDEVPRSAVQEASIVLADDNTDMREYIARLLRSQGYTVRPVADGRQALDAVRTAPADLVLTDVMMPWLDGFGLLKAVRGDAALAATPVILLSARAGEEARAEGLQAGADDYLVKPFSARELLARVGGALALARIRQHARETEDRLRAQTAGILESIGEGFVALDAEWRIVYINAAAERISGLQREQVLGKNHWEVYPPTRGTPVETHLRRSMQEREVVHFQHFYPPWQRWFETHCYPVAEGGGIAVYFQDITERKQAEERSREAERRKDEFIATLAHELRNPLAPIRTGLEVLRRHPESAAAADVRDMMARQVAHMVRLIDDLMDVARISQGKLELRKELVPLDEVVQSAVETSRPLVDAARHVLQQDLPSEPVWLEADPTRLAQGLANLLSNAAKYTPPGGRIGLRARAAGGRLRIEVSDTGMGVPAHLMPSLFEMFMQGDSTRERAQGGLGIGLTLVRQLVRLHGGEVTGTSPGPGQGSTFTIELPLPQKMQSSGPQRGLDGAHPGPGLKILVADDNEDAATSLAMLLQMMGHSPVAVHDGAAALEAFARMKPDVALLDLGMPRMDGYEVARRIRAAHGAHCRLFALTGWGTSADRAQTHEAGFDLHLTKPVDLATLESVLRTATAPQAAPAATAPARSPGATAALDGALGGPGPAAR